ncbi:MULTISPECIES: Anti-sigma-K factor rskA [Pseudoalteromonas]|uniref:Anti-sigma-K factor rskA n=1 Tax=Pseudoalteromonas luteoviolacea (strain 2ta16) TaxID=1353533 RepID=V4H3A0_PSEL2|nr:MULTISPECIES: Anti-sigma-K factor rskA [Pseudoalteromonas]ESP91906.1 Anti-sigma-K factor rskA [Pseudoalteromonas luteoviolacea 2ta16]MCG7548996.1 hypothetical protein [Pseudoalteromonas sp. Of7M-16]
MTKPNFDEFLSQQIANTQEQVQQPEPQRALWQGIEKAINEQPKNDSEPQKYKSAGVWRQVSAIAAATCIGMCVMYFTLSTPEQNNMMQMSQYFEQQKQILLVQYGNQPALTNDWQVQLQELEEAEQAIKLALQNDPQNAALLQMLAQVYQQQLDLIERVHQPRWQEI